MDGDIGYHLMSTGYVPAELKIYTKTDSTRIVIRVIGTTPVTKSSNVISTWTAVASCPTVESTVESTRDSTALSTASTATATASTLVPPLIIYPPDTNNLTTITNADANPKVNLTVTNVVVGDTKKAAVPTSTACVSGTVDSRANGGHLHECADLSLERELELEPSTAHARHIRSDGSRVELYQEDRPRFFRKSTRAVRSLPDHVVPVAELPASSNYLPQARPGYDTRDTVSLESPISPRRLYKRRTLQRKPTHQILRIPPILSLHSSTPSLTFEPLVSAADDRHPHAPHPPFPTTLYIPGDMPRSSNHAFSSHSGVMTSNEDLGSMAERSGGGHSSISIATSTASRPQFQLQGSRAFVVRNGRTYINDNSLPYPLPVDLSELHRQSLRTLLMFQLFGGPIFSSAFASKPPTNVLDVGCGAGFWSMMCHRYFVAHGHSSISFTGLDIVPLGGSGNEVRPDKDMKWRFVQHDMRQFPWPFADGEFDLVMEYLRVLRPGGVLEFWETDSSIRMLRPHAPRSTPLATRHHDSDDDSSSDGGDNEDNAERMGAYVMTTNTPISAPLNTYLVEYNGWLSKALEQRGLSAVPCTLIGAYLLQESESVMDVQSKRLAVPLSEIRWEREGVGGVVTKGGKSYIDSQKGKAKDQDWKAGSPLSAAQSALRRTALETTVNFILALEPLLRESGNKSQEEWDTWAGKMANDLLREGGTSWGECLEVGVWTSRKRHNSS
ncbi:hypothetical protein GGS20DRAFT_580918 [Poronia punctata]|nr:hypothetical protein GGS20DRAFT_580918 [Poronia punctata]